MTAFYRVMNIRPLMLRQDVRYAGDKQYPTFLIIKRIYERSWPEDWNTLAAGLSNCIDEYSNADLRPMGFPKDWEKPLGL